MPTSRSGSAILFCMALAVIALMVGYAFLRAAARQDMSGRNEMMTALAREAALSGLAHATEQILTDYNAPSLVVATNGGPVTVISAPTFLDGPYRAPFVSVADPDKIPSAYTDDLLTGHDNVSVENLVPSNFTSISPGVTTGAYSTENVNYDGRGRFIEVNYHNIARPNPSVTPKPVNEVRFADPAATASDRTDGLFLDQELHRLTSGTPAQQRKTARYRLRYALGVIDLSGHLLSNPIPDMNWDWKDGNNLYRKPPHWFDASAYAWANMVASWQRVTNESLRAAHVFRGRGSTSNADRCWSNANPARVGLPAAFPRMFRFPGLWYAMTNTSRLYEFPGGGFGPCLYEQILPAPGGNQILTPVGGYLAPPTDAWTPWAMNEGPSNVQSYHPYAHALTGPQYSWSNQMYAVGGTTQEALGGTGESFYGDRARHLTIPTPFGRRQERSATTGPNQKWYEGRVDTPWQVNLLTAPTRVTNAMISAYLQPHILNYHYTTEVWYPKTGVGVNTDAFGVDHPYDIYSAVPSYTETNGGLGWNSSSAGVDILNDQLGNGFAEFPAPSSAFPGNAAEPVPSTVKPDYYQNPKPVPLAKDLYPGPLCRGDSANVDEGSDNLGKDIDISGNGIGRCAQTGNPFLYIGGDDYEYYTVDAGHAGAVGDQWRVERKIDPALYQYKYSYTWDLAMALTTTLSYARATWTQYPSAFFTPSTGFSPATLRDPMAYNTIQKIDALFLRQMGENFAAPGTPCPEHPVMFDGLTKYIVQATPVSNTIRSLVTADLIKTASGVPSAERSKVMERMLNDVRLTFFGASPAYSDTFTPMDFDGDGKAMCSGYEINGSATAEEVKYRTARWKSAPGNVGPTLTPFATPTADFGTSPWFCVSGCFYIGKSHFFRILCRGEVFDNLLKKPVASQTVEKVVSIDPEAPLHPAANRISPNNQVLFQRWHYNNNRSELPRQTR